jgi:S1-C subfamily serine protease
MDAPVRTARDVVPAVVELRARIPQSHPSAAVLGEERLGAAVAVAPNAALTAHYLVLGASEMQLAALDGRRRPVETVAIDHEIGLALLRLGGPPLSPVTVASSDGVRPGEPVFMLTCAGGGERKGATGHVTEVGPFEAFWEYMLDRAIMTTIVNPGLAGAPLFDARGRLIGVVSLGLAAVGRYSLAVPSALYLERREELFGNQPRTRPARGWIGFYPQASDDGVVVTGVVPGGPADLAGLAHGDVVLSLDGVPASSLRELYLALWRHSPGARFGLKLLRDDELLEVLVTAGDRDRFYR